MSQFAEEYYKRLFDTLSSISVRGGGGAGMTFAEGVSGAVELIKAGVKGHKLMFIGNGGSAAISSHLSVDFWKNGGMRAVAFNDSSLLTSIGNDNGYRHVFEKPVEMFADEGDILIAISSSGRSENILLAVGAARKKGCRVITLSGFDRDNPLAAMGDINFYVPSNSYGPVEVLHYSICHCILDAITAHDHG